MMERILVSFPNKIMKLIDGELKDIFGKAKAEIVRTIVIAYLSEKGYLNKKREEP